MSLLDPLRRADLVKLERIVETCMDELKYDRRALQNLRQRFSFIERKVKDIQILLDTPNRAEMPDSPDSSEEEVDDEVAEDVQGLSRAELRRRLGYGG